jgi:hypothetical protein
MPLELEALALEAELAELLDASAEELDALDDEEPPPPPPPPELDDESPLLALVASVPDEASAELVSPADVSPLDDAVVSSGMSS